MAENHKNKKDNFKTQQKESGLKDSKNTSEADQSAVKHTVSDKKPSQPQIEGSDKTSSDKKTFKQDGIQKKKTEKSSEAKMGQAEKASQSEESLKTDTNKKPSSPQTSSEEQAKLKEQIKLEGLFAFKVAMTTFYNEKGESVPVTALKYEPCRVSQIKNQDKKSYSAVQVAFKAQKNKRCSKALIGHLSSSGFKEGARFVREIRQTIPEGIKPGQEVSIESLKKGDLVKISSLSKGRGFAGVMKRWNFAGGKASHGSKSHRRTGSIGQHTEPSRVMPGRKMPGQYGSQQVSRLKVSIVDVLPEEEMIFVKGPVPGARNTLVSLRKMPNAPS